MRRIDLEALERFFGGKNQNLKILLAAFIVIFLRSPMRLIFGRIQAEEATVYFQDAWNKGLHRAFFSPHQGYFSLLDNGVSAVAAHLVPLSWVAFTFTFAALLILLLTTYLIISCELFETTQAKLLAASISVLSPSVEVWLTLEDAQFYLAASVAVIFLSSENRHKLIRSGTLLLAGLTGPVACAFLPFYCIRAVQKKTFMATIQTIILALCTVIQGWIILHALHSGVRSVTPPEQLRWLGPVFLIKVLSLTFATRLSYFLIVSLLVHHYSTLLFLLCWFVAFVGLIFFFLQARKGGSSARWLLALAIWIFLFQYPAISVSNELLLIGEHRYFFVPNLLFWLLLLVTYLHEKKASASSAGLSKKVVFLILFCGLFDAVGYWTRIQNVEPAWRPQIAQWKKDHSVLIRVPPKEWKEELVLGEHDRGSIRPATNP